MERRLHLNTWRNHLALDLGTAAIRVASCSGPVLELPTCPAEKTGLSGGVVVDEATVTRLLKPVLAKKRLFGIVKPRVLACAPSDTSRDERARLTTAVLDAGAESVYIIPEPIAAAVGAGLDVSSPYSHLVMDIGAGVTDCALIRMSRIQSSVAARVGCRQIQRGKEGPENSAIEMVTAMLEGFIHALPPEIGCEVIESGICLTGGGAMIPGLRAFLENRTGIAVTTAKFPCRCVVEGARAILPVVVMLNLWDE